MELHIFASFWIMNKDIGPLGVEFKLKNFILKIVPLNGDTVVDQVLIIGRWQLTIKKVGWCWIIKCLIGAEYTQKLNDRNYLSFVGLHEKVVQLFIPSKLVKMWNEVLVAVNQFKGKFVHLISDQQTTEVQKFLWYLYILPAEDSNHFDHLW